MTELELVAPVRTAIVGFSLSPARNALSDLHLFLEADHTSGFDEWVYRTVAGLSAEQLRTTQLVVYPLCTGCTLVDGVWESVPAWLDDVAARDATEIRDLALEHMIGYFRDTLGDGNGVDLSPAALLADRDAYLSLVARMVEHKGKDKHEAPDLDLHGEAHVLFNDPPAMKDLIVTHLRAMWEDVLAPEWERTLPDLRASVAAFEALDLAGASFSEALHRVTGREMPADWEEMEREAETIVFVPSAHVGPYLLNMGVEEGTVHIVFGARIPEEVSYGAPVVGRSELLMRLSALADDTRLRILEILAREGEMGAQDVMARLDLSQSAASRHLRQLLATGYLSARRHEGSKIYRVKRGHIDDTLEAVKECCECCEDE